jgi:hypothetical protein
VKVVVEEGKDHWENECERKKATAVKAMELHWDNSKLLTIRNE